MKFHIFEDKGEIKISPTRPNCAACEGHFQRFTEAQAFAIKLLSEEREATKENLNKIKNLRMKDFLGSFSENKRTA